MEQSHTGLLQQLIPEGGPGSTSFLRTDKIERLGVGDPPNLASLYFASLAAASAIWLVSRGIQDLYFAITYTVHSIWAWGLFCLDTQSRLQNKSFRRALPLQESTSAISNNNTTPPLWEMIPIPIPSVLKSFTNGAAGGDHMSELAVIVGTISISFPEILEHYSRLLRWWYCGWKCHHCTTLLVSFKLQFANLYMWTKVQRDILSWSNLFIFTNNTKFQLYRVLYCTRV